MNGGSVTVMEFVRLGEYPGSHGQFLVNGRRVCTTEIGNGAGKIIRRESELATAWPSYTPGEAPVDSMDDGIPDEWKHAHGLQLNDAGVAGLVK